MLAKLSRTKDGTMLMNQPGHLVTADCVILPSHKEAYRDDTKAMNVVHKAIESAGSDITEEQYKDMVFAVNEAMFIDFIQEESNNFKLVKNVEEVIGDGIKLTKDLNNIIIKEGTDTYYVKVEDKIKHDIRNFMSKF
jgi:disulfide oxidoreductase YuzD